MDIPLAVETGVTGIPEQAQDGDAGYDLVAQEECVLAPGGGRATVSAGIRLAIPAGFAGLVLPRSGLAARHGVTCINAPGLIDSGYRGVVRVALVNLDPHRAYVVRRGDRIAQLVIVPVAAARFVASSELPPSARGAGGFGSTGR